jgi:hypothetical protein
MKKLVVGAAVCAVVVAAAVVLLVGNLDRIVKKVIEDTGSKIIGTRVTVAEVKVDLKDGAGQIVGLRIANPAGYSSAAALETEMVRLELKLRSLKEQPLVVRELKVQDPVVRLEARVDGSSNLQTLLKNIEKNSADADGRAAEGQPGSKSVPGEESPRISFGTLSITGVEVHADIPGQKPETVVMPDIVMRNVGGAAGLTPAEIGTVILGEVLRRSLEAALKKTMTDKVKEATQGLLKDLRKKLER